MRYETTSHHCLAREGSALSSLYLLMALPSASHTPQSALALCTAESDHSSRPDFRQSGPRFIYSCFDEYVQNLILETLFINWYTKIMGEPTLLVNVDR
jgi:hypothetical protein